MLSSTAVRVAVRVTPLSARAPVVVSAPIISPLLPSFGVLARTMFGQSFDVGYIEATERVDRGSRASRRAREDGMVPGILYGLDSSGKEEEVCFYVKSEDLRREVNSRGESLENTLYDINIDGVTTRVLPRQFAAHPATNVPFHINFVRYRPGARPGARIEIPTKVINEDKCIAFKDGGWLFQLKYKIPVFAAGETIPNCLIIDLRGKRVGDKVWASEVYLNEGLMLRSQQQDFPVAKLVGARRGVQYDNTSLDMEEVAISA